MRMYLILLAFFASAAVAEPICVKLADGEPACWLDGDTVRIADITYRVTNIDTPELAQPFGRQAQRAAADWSHGRNIRIWVAGEDKYGRMLAQICVAEDTPSHCLDGVLIERGLAWVYRDYVNPDLAPSMIALENLATLTHTGLWIDSDPVAPWDWRRGHR